MMNNITNPIHTIETQEVIDKLKEAGFAELVDCLLDNEKDCYTKKGRLNKSSTCRRLNWKGKKLEDALQEMRAVLQVEYDLEIEEDQESDEEEEE
jgi:gamma-glutamyl phosphate reductase